MTTPSHEKDIGYERLLTVTDGIFSIAITLLALEIRIPDLENRAQLGQAIINLLPQIFIFVLSFAQVGIFWLAHYRMFRYIERSDNSFMALCLVYLMLIAFLPVTSGTLGRYGNEFPGVEFLAITLLLLGLIELAIWEYASFNHRLLRPNVTDLQIKEVRWRTYGVILVFCVSIVIAFVSPMWAMLSWLLLFPTRLLITRHFDQSSGSHPAGS